MKKQTQEPTYQDIFIMLQEMQQILAHIVEHGATKQDIQDLRAEFKGDISSVRLELKKELSTIRLELKKDINAVNGTIYELENSIHTQLQGVKAELTDARIDRKTLHKKMAKHVDDFMRLHLQQKDEIGSLAMRMQRLEKNPAT